ncbi:olfactory receptor 5V1-like [Pelobates cultripes]|uniref:Olfactory receptor 5V1-like n=1 Tax=Pelobates cultripes TaxID=61616 RepID=A0AAD1T8I4_PELCU|nr:olfactory receptor 5V1-like [Pelobates cultripes]
MACDRYVAICQPLRYTTIINGAVCNYLSAFALLSGLLNSTINTPLTASLMFCSVNATDRLYCEVQPLIRLSCADTSLNDIFVTASAAVFGPEDQEGQTSTSSHVHWAMCTNDKQFVENKVKEERLLLEIMSDDHQTLKMVSDLLKHLLSPVISHLYIHQHAGPYHNVDFLQKVH